MKTNVIKKSVAVLLVAIIIAMGLVLLVQPTTTAEAAKKVSDYFAEDGTYIVPIETDLKMAKEYFDTKATVEKENGCYYVSYKVLAANFVDNFTLHIGNSTDKFGFLTRNEDAHREAQGQKIYSTEYTYSVSEELLNKNNYYFTMLINVMGMNVDFYMWLKPESAYGYKPTIEDRGERPAVFVPTIRTNAASTEKEYGSDFVIAPAKASLGGEDLEVTTSAYFDDNGTKVPVTIADNKFKLDKKGNYYLVYRAESDKYKTNRGNNAFSEVKIKITSKVDARENAKVVDINGVFPEGTVVQSGMVEKTSPIYIDAVNAMKDYSDHFEVVSISAFDKEGNTPEINKDVAIYLVPNKNFDFNEIEVYLLKEDGSIKKMNNNSFVVTDDGHKLIRIVSSDLGNYIMCVPGVTKPVPIPMIAGGVGAVVVVILIIVIVVAVVKKKKKKKAIANGTYVPSKRDLKKLEKQKNKKNNKQPKKSKKLGK